MQEVRPTPCSNCSCKCGVKYLLDDEEGEFGEHLKEYIENGTSFKCYMRKEDKACCIMRKALDIATRGMNIPTGKPSDALP